MLLCAMTLAPLAKMFHVKHFAVHLSLLAFEDHTLIGADRRWIAQIRSDPGVAKISLPAFGDFGFTLRPVGFERCLPGQLRLAEIGEALVGEGEEESDEIVDFGFAQRKPLHATVEKR